MSEEEHDEEAVEQEDVVKQDYKRPRIEMPFYCYMEIPFASERSAQITRDSLAVDAELTPDKVHKNLTVKNSLLCIEIYSTEKRLLRASLTSVLDMAMVAARFLCEFSDD